MRLPIVLLALWSVSAPALAQVPAHPIEEARVAEGRALLARGDAAAAATLGRDFLQQFPANAAVLEFAVDAEIARAGASSGLATYDCWAAANRQEDERALHRIARATLREAAAGAGTPALRREALQALAADGDADAATALASDAQQAGAGTAAATGDDRAVTALLAQLQTPMMGVERRRVIAALGESRSPRAVTPLIDTLSDPNPDVRMAAAEALGKLGAPQAIGPLKNLLSDPMFPVHYQAAAALFALKDPSGLPWLRQLERSPQPGIQLAAAQALRSQPDPAWLNLVRDLAQSPDAEIRRQAAELLGPHDPEAARAAIEPLLGSPNVAERDAATTSYLREVETDLGALRRYLRGAPPATRAQAAMRLLELTR